MSTLLTPSRRLMLGAGFGLVLAAGASRASFAAAENGANKLVFIILRGAMDGLSAVVPFSAPEYRSLRGQLALDEPGSKDGVLALNNTLGLHPSLTGLKALWDAKQLSFLHAASTPYRDRSHFEAQDVLESGANRAYGSQDGWLNRAIGLLPNGPNREGVGISRTIPLVLRGSAKASSWAPALAPGTDPDTLNRLADLYAYDALLGPALARAVETDAILGDGGATMDARSGGGAARAFGYTQVASAAAKLLSAENGPSAAVLSFEGWDTHANQGGITGQLANRLQGLDAAITTLKTDLGPVWNKTAVIVATEFGRTARVNGTGGTDHGTGGVALLLGGGVKGGQMLGDWPGLGTLYQDRDLQPANDIRALFAGVMAEHWGLDRAALNERVFNGVRGELKGLV
jgi:uncharacterized protein (DUF1501 family)